VLADKAYDADRIRELIQDQGATPNIPPKSNRRWKPCFSKRLYRERNLIERFFSKLKHFRRVATRYDKLAANFLAMIQLASMRLWLRAYESLALLWEILSGAGFPNQFFNDSWVVGFWRADHGRQDAGLERRAWTLAQAVSGSVGS
jgi:hypothetical protein